jgi:hypothetical protein
MNIGHHPVLIVPPGSKAGKIMVNARVVRVENMGTVFVDQNACVVAAVVSVAADMTVALDQQHAPAAPLGQLTGGDSARKTSAYDKAVEGCSHEMPPPIVNFGFFYSSIKDIKMKPTKSLIFSAIPTNEGRNQARRTGKEPVVFCAAFIYNTVDALQLQQHSVFTE